MIEAPFKSIPIWTIYRNPTDFPGKFVARRHDIFRDGPKASDEYFTAATLDEIRAALPFGLACLTRSEEDEPQIVESWI
jgi:hypothetical protein